MPEADLRARLVKVGVDLLTRDGPQALSLREIARSAGVSHGAPRRYFPTHQALLAAIAREGYHQLGQQITDAVRDESEPARSRVLQLGRVYLDFARGNRGMFELMFRHDLLQGNQIGLREVSRQLFAVLVDLVGKARPGVSATVVAGAIWANLHGVALLRQWGSLEIAMQTTEIDPLLHASIDAYLG
ncbi:TetR family transcriptional regulator [Rhizocola hellebori]|uniref:TetR family transcriptional regulator n=1 Tax=Rhizocola hellebori TaxID=1392758 RepID=A0A8J3QGT1_9ACTN|nr:TetR/AcrR family transcriptional regulator [Rhizocola hellebori]GIH10590.1 TetR family transcriptional regulator [Rhizocola hellebori]